MQRIQPQNRCVSPALADGVLPTPSRADFFLFPKRKGDPFRVTIDTENQVDLKPVKTLWQDGSARVTIRSFQWNAAVIKFPFKERAMSDWDPLRKWFMHWFKEDDPEPGELLGAVHFVSDPECIEGVVDILVDFGTAPVESFFELLDALVALGAETIDVGD